VAIVGVDNDDLLCSIAQPPLSSVRIPWERVGDEAARLLVRLFSGQTVTDDIVVSPAEVAVRQSTDVCAVTDPHVAAALMIIRRRAHEPLNRPGYSARSAVYQHRLQRGFRQLVGEPCWRRFGGVRVERARHLLTTTDLTMAQVAKANGLCQQQAASAKSFGAKPTAAVGVPPQVRTGGLVRADANAARGAIARHSEEAPPQGEASSSPSHPSPMDP